MGTTVWVDENTRSALRQLQTAFGLDSVNATIQRLLRQPAPDAHAIFAKHREAISAVLRRNHLRRLIAFGSRARGDASPTSDLDLAVQMGAKAGPLAILTAETELEQALGLRVHIVEYPTERLKKVLQAEGIPFDP